MLVGAVDMNERIKELIAQASSWVEVECDHGIDSEYQLDAEKFAELIVRECAYQCVQNEYYNAYSIDSLGATKAAKSFKKYFEVK